MLLVFWSRKATSEYHDGSGERYVYQAEAYEYPLAFLTLPDGRTGIVHCPHSYAKLEIEEVESGECLTQRDAPPLDFFHSRLAVSTDNRYLLNAGWIWHPLDMVQIYDLTHAYSQPASFDTLDTRFRHPKLIELKTGKVIRKWLEIESGKQASSIIHHIPKPPPIALDTQNKRFAIASPDAITVIELG